MEAPTTGNHEAGSQFVFPTFEDEVGEIERVGKHFGITDPDFVANFLKRARDTRLVQLEEEMWTKIDNTDSHADNIPVGDWEAVAACAKVYDTERDWQALRDKMRRGVPLDAPIIARRGDALHLVGGNTRLMVARAFGIEPKVLIVDITDFN